MAHYYEDAPAVSRHLAECEACRASWENMRAGLEALQPAAPDPDAGFEQRIWSRIEPKLRPSRPVWRPVAALAVAAAALIAAFLAGRYSTVAEPPRETAQVRERVLMVALAEHLDQTQMLLVELSNADPEQPRIGIDQELTDYLVMSNRMLRQTAASGGRPGLASTLEELERVLVEVAHGPSEWTAGRLEEIRQIMADEGILFKVRVLKANLQGQKGRVTF